MKRVVSVVVFFVICGAVVLSTSGSAADRFAVSEVQPVKIDRSVLLERQPVAGAEKNTRATATMGPLNPLLSDGGAAYSVGFGTTTFFMGHQWNAPADFPTSWFPFAVTAVRAWAVPSQGASAVRFGARQVGQTGVVTGTAPGTAATVFSGSLVGANVTASGFSAGVEYVDEGGTTAPKVHPVWRCATGAGVAPQQANQRWFTASGVGALYSAGTCSSIIGAGGAYPFMVVADSVVTGATVPVELMTFQVD